MEKIWKNLLELLGFSSTDITALLAILSKNLTASAFLTIIILLITIAVPILITRPIADLFDRRAKRNERNDRVRDVTIAAYHEIFSEFRGMIEAFAKAEGEVQEFEKRMEEDPKYFPFWTFNENDLFVFESYVKEDIAIYPSTLIGPTVEVYRSAGSLMAYMKDCRSEAIEKLPVWQKVQFLKNVYDAAYEHIVICCSTLAAYETWQYRSRMQDYADMSWLMKMSEFDFSKLADLHEALDDDGTHHPGRRLAAYRVVLDRFDGLLNRPLAGPPAAAATGS
jgi:hypothetical protein